MIFLRNICRNILNRACSSCSIIQVRWLFICGVEEADEVLYQSLTFSATANLIRCLGATPILVDSGLRTWNINPKLLEEAILDRIEKGLGKKPKAIVVVHLYGIPARMDWILRVRAKYDIPVIEGATEARDQLLMGANAAVSVNYQFSHSMGIRLSKPLVEALY